MPAANSTAKESGTTKSRTTKKTAARANPQASSKTSGKSSTFKYDVHPGVAMVQKWIEDMPEKTGKSFDQWLALIKKSGPKDEKALKSWLKEKHSFGGNTASWLAERSMNKEMGLGDEDPKSYLKLAPKYVDDMYAKKPDLRPMHDTLLKLGRSIGNDVRICPCKTIVPFYRNNVFAQIKPTTKSRIDFGLALKKCTGKLPARLIDTGGAAKGDRITHRIEITSMKDIDSVVEKWARAAYELDG